MKTTALYARVSSEKQAREATIASQVEALRARARADGSPVHAADEYLDDGVSGGTLIRPALERLRDAVADGRVARVYVLAPDRLARRYAYQVLLLEEFARAGVEVIFEQGGGTRSPSEELLVQMQGMIAEYERASIAERTRRGRLHKARAGNVSVLCAAPYGYTYIPKAVSGVAEYRINEDEAKVVRHIFRSIALEGVSASEVARRLNAEGRAAPRRSRAWNVASITGMVANPAYAGMAEFGKRESVPRQTPLRLHRNQQVVTKLARSSTRARPPEERIQIPVPALIERGLQAAAQAQLVRNKKTAPRNATPERYLLQGLLECEDCGYAFCGVHRRSTHGYTYYRCSHSGSAAMGRTCPNGWVRADALEKAVWTSVCRVLSEPERALGEWTRRNTADGTVATLRDAFDAARRTVAQAERTLERVLDAYEAGLLDIEQLRERRERALDRITRERRGLLQAEHDLNRTVELTALASTIESFRLRLTESLDSADWHLQQKIIRAIVAKVTIGQERTTITYRIEPSVGPTDPSDSSPDIPDSSPSEGTPACAPSQGDSSAAGRGAAGFVLLPLRSHARSVETDLRLCPLPGDSRRMYACVTTNG